MFLLSGRFGALASRIGPRIPMGVGPLIAAASLLWLLRLDHEVDYLVDLLPAMLVFGVGLAMTVAPLTTTVLDTVEERHSGIASGTNNAVSRVAGVLAIAAIGAAISAVGANEEQPLSGGPPAVVESSEDAFHVGLLIGAGLMAIGGAIALAGVRNPERPPVPERHHDPGPIATAGECGRPGSWNDTSPVPGTLV
jgi:MFS family permease